LPQRSSACIRLLFLGRDAALCWRRGEDKKRIGIESLRAIYSVLAHLPGLLLFCSRVCTFWRYIEIASRTQPPQTGTTANGSLATSSVLFFV
jgi:hypothetical protein